MNTSAKYQANWTETVGGVVRTRFCRQTDRLIDRLILVYNPQICLWEYNYDSFTLHSVLFQQTQLPGFKSIKQEMTKLCSGKRT